MKRSKMVKKKGIEVLRHLELQRNVLHDSAIHTFDFNFCVNMKNSNVALCRCVGQKMNNISAIQSRQCDKVAQGLEEPSPALENVQRRHSVVFILCEIRMQSHKKSSNGVPSRNR